MKKKTILVTGGYGFMGSDFIRLLLEESDFHIVNLDLLTYAGNKKNLINNPRLESFVIDICDKDFVEKLFIKYQFLCVVHFAAETHVDRSIDNPIPFIHSNIVGTVALLEILQKFPNTHFHYISTDEVYGDLEKDGSSFTLGSTFHPSSPYSASKAAADLFCQAYSRTFGLNMTISRSSNNFGPYQYKEKLIPKMIHNAIVGDDLPLYGDGKNLRDWIFVKDHSRAVMKILQRRKFGEIYHIGSGVEKTNIEVCEAIIKEVSIQTGRECKSKIIFVKDRKGHDFRYSLDIAKTNLDLNFCPEVEFNQGIKYVVSTLLHERKA